MSLDQEGRGAPNELEGALQPEVEREVLCFKPHVFAFLLRQELLRAQRYCHFVAVLMVRLAEEHPPEEVVAGLARSVRLSVRSTDYLGVYDQQTLMLLLLNCGIENTRAVMGRLTGDVALHMKGKPAQIKSSSAVFPTEASSLESLQNLAMQRLSQGEIQKIG